MAAFTPLLLLLIGITIVGSLSADDAIGCALFCCTASSTSACCKSASASGGREMYVGREYVYSFHADSPIKVMELASSLAATLAQQRDRLQAQQAAPVFASVIGSLSGLNMLSKAQLRDPSHVILYDMNPWMLDYARLIVELIRMSSSPEEYLSRLLSRPVQTSFVASNASAILPLTEQQRIQQSFLSLPPDSSLTHAGHNPRTDAAIGMRLSMAM